MSKTIVSWKGRTVYRKCSCGETAHDAEYVALSLEFEALTGKQFTYKCRNCRNVIGFRK